MNVPLEALLDTLLPGDVDWPPGRSIAAALDPSALPAFATLQAALPADFTAGDETALQKAATAEPAAFERAVTEAYTAYYTDAAVRVVIERLTGYAARPPQPEGYVLPPFDLDLLRNQIGRKPFWRSTDPA